MPSILTLSPPRPPLTDGSDSQLGASASGEMEIDNASLAASVAAPGAGLDAGGGRVHANVRYELHCSSHKMLGALT